MRTIPLLAALCSAMAAPAGAADWPTYRADAARTGYTEEPLPARLAAAWEYHAPHPPESAWPHRDRLTYDRAYQPVIAGGRVFFGSSSDDAVRALDAASGRTLWSFLADAPVRLAPVAWRDRVFAVSDDGHLYCLNAEDGRLLWKLRGGPRDEMLLGNDRMISRWPARGGPVILDDTLYFAAGLWPSEGIFLRAVDPESGKVLWSNDTSGSIEMNQPHPTARAVSGLSAQGHLVAAGDTLLVPTGRAVPAALDRADGRFRYFHLQANRALGGSEVVAFDGRFANRGPLFAMDTGKLVLDAGPGATQPGEMVVVHPRWVVHNVPGKPGTLVGRPRDTLVVPKETVDRKGKKQTIQVLAPPTWTTALSIGPVHGLIVAGDRIIAGGEGKICLVEVATGKELGATAVPGTVYALAAADGRLVASTDRGAIVCFDGARHRGPLVHKPQPATAASGADSPEAKAADAIVRETGVREGYCLDLGCGDGRLALELARRAKLRIYAVDPDPRNVEKARDLFVREGLQGVRVVVHQADPKSIPYADYFADLVVSGRSVSDPAWLAEDSGDLRWARPFGGMTCLGPPNAMRKAARGPLEGVASWTHQYADPANTLCANDAQLHGPLAMLWFRDTDLFMPNRHGRGPAPLVDRGRMFVEGVDALRAIDAYNGRTLWEVAMPGILLAYHQEHLMGTAGTGSNVCLGGDRVFVHNGKKCLALDAATGRTLAEIQTPTAADGKPGTWGFLAFHDGILFGSLANTEHLVTYRFLRSDMGQLYTESRALFAADPDTGKILWTHPAEHSLRHNAIAIGAGRVHLIDRPLARGDEPQPKTQDAKGKQKPPHEPGRIVALDAKTGKLVWQSPPTAFGTMLVLSCPHDVLLECYQATRFRLDSEVGGRMAAHRASTGEPLWDAKASYESRPLVNDRTIYAQPGAWDLLSGKKLPFQFARSYGCGILAGSTRMLVFRSATIGYFDLEGDKALRNYGGIRPGCWINAVPAGGLVLMADAASWCTCSYLNQATIALQPR
ncbi:MAG: PQQ-binding-like beta-propeller repeat protein [Pirellulales bacterium]|nr:PQQ-binding-like beta-propeller repeat protein [Pirellulales bacterium]